MPFFVHKGDKIIAWWLESTNACLAGAQLKTGSKSHYVVGIVRHVRGNDPVNPTVVRLYVDVTEGALRPQIRPSGCTCKVGHAEIRPENIVSIDPREIE